LIGAIVWIMRWSSDWSLVYKVCQL
jgi:hypothetical protein